MELESESSVDKLAKTLVGNPSENLADKRQKTKDKDKNDIKTDAAAGAAATSVAPAVKIVINQR